MEYLGHIISGKGAEVDLEKIRSIKEWPVQTSVREVRGFLGLTGYCRKFVTNYGSVAAPLTQLLKKEAFEWTVKAQEAFEKFFFFVETEARTSLLIRTQSARELYKESQKEVVNKGNLEGSGGAPGYLN